jgi:D-glycero-alpha-D-manno-heptose-7-phosphate kinase
MIISRTPFRISFVGGGSDMAAFYERHPGAVLSTSINQYMYISSHKYFEPDKIRVKYSETETVSAAVELKHPILRVALQRFNLNGIEISSIADVPAGTGMGSSSAFTVGLLHNLYAVAGIQVTKERLAEEACKVEIEELGEPIGKQDQYGAAIGGLNIFRFLSNGQVITEPLTLNPEIRQELDANLLMFYTGNQRKASSILAEQKKNVSQEDRFAALKEMTALVDVLAAELLKGNINAMGTLLHENWEMKKSLAGGISNPLVDQAYELALKNGATGGKLLGAGGGGFLLFYCPKPAQAKLRQALSNLRTFDFGFEQEGTTLIYPGQ